MAPLLVELYLDCAASVPSGAVIGDGARIPHPDGIFLALY
jgi:hypothetical protein